MFVKDIISIKKEAHSGPIFKMPSLLLGVIAVFATETLYATCRIHKFLLTGKKRVAA
jgi:hypothetical protein